MTDLHLDIDLSGGRRSGVERALRAAIRDGRLAAGTPLPSSRALAADLGVARGTIVDAYDQLAGEGYVRATPGGRTEVAAGVGADPTDATGGVAGGAGVAAGAGVAGGAAAGAGGSAGRVGGVGESGGAGRSAGGAGESGAVGDGSVDRERAAPPWARFDLRTGSPDPSSFPAGPWLAALRRALRDGPDAAGYGDRRGRAELRAALAAHLARTRGVVVAPDRVVVCAGYTEGLGLLAAALAATGRTVVAMEDPCLPMHRSVVAAGGATVVPAPVDDLGADAAALPSDAGGAVVTPAHQVGLGVTLAPARRSALVAWARAGDRLVVEDDYDGEFRYDRQPVGALQGLDPAHVVYAGTAGKSLGPGLRLGWLVLPPSLLEPVLDRRGPTSPVAVPEQLALADLLDSHALDRHVRRMRGVYRRRRDAMVAALAAGAPAVRVDAVAAGLHAVLRWPAALATEDELVAACRDRGVAVQGLGPWWHGEQREAALLVGYARPPAHAWRQALAALTAAIADAVGT